MKPKGYTILILLFYFIPESLFSQLPELTIQTGHTDVVTTLAFSADGRYLASAGKDNMIIIWDYSLGKQIKRLTGHTGAVNSLKFFSSGSKLASCGDDGKILIWDLNTETVIHSMPQVRTARIVAFDLSPDEGSIIFCGNPYYLGRWDLNTNALSDLSREFSGSPISFKFKLDLTDYKSIGYSKDGKIFFVTKSEGVYIFNKSDAASDRIYESVNHGSRQASKKPKVRSFLWTWADDKLREFVLADIFVNQKKKTKSVLSYPEVLKWDSQRNKRAFSRSSDFNRFKFTSGSVNADHSLMAAGNEDNSIYIWDFVKGKRSPCLEGTSPVSALLFHPLEKNILVASYTGREICIWDIGERRIIRKLTSTTFPITTMAVNKAGDLVTLAGSDNSIRILSLKENITLRCLRDNQANICGLGFTPDGESIVSAGLDNRIKFWSPDTDKLNVSLKGNINPSLFNAVLHLPVLSVFANTFTSYFFTKSLILNNRESLTSMNVSGDNRLTAAGGTGFRSGYFYKFLYPRMMPIHIIDNQNRKTEQTLPGHYISVDALAFNSNGRLLASAGHDYKMSGKAVLEKNKKKKGTLMTTDLAKNYNEINSLKIWDLGKNKLSAAFENRSPVRSIAFGSKNDSLLLADDDRNVVLFDYKTNTASKLQRGTGPLTFFKDGKSFLFQDQDYAINQCDLASNSVMRLFRGHTDKITSAILINNDKRLLTTGWDGTLKLWDVQKGSEIVTFYAINDNDFLIRTPDDYYFATKNAVNEIGFTLGMKFYPFEQFDLKYNRPDIVLKQLGNTSPQLIAAYYRAYQKRIKKLGFTEEMLGADFHVPEVTIADKELIQQVTDKRDLTIKVSAEDSKYKLDRINVWINDVAIFGKNGIDKRPSDSQSSTDDITIRLASGVNKIQVSALNQKGAESLKETFEVNCNAPVAKPDLYLVSVGISKYNDSRFNLNYASKDASDISSLFRGDTSLYKNIYIKTLTDEQVTASRLDELRTFFAEAGRDDVVMMFVAGHGLLDTNLDYYFGTYDMDFNNPDGKGIIYDNIEALFDGLSSLKKILFMDTCFSGEVDKDEVELAQNTNTEFGNVTFRSAGAGVRMKEAFGTENTTEIMKELFTDIRKGTGSTVISSAGGAEFAMESDQWKNGLFTFCVLNGINKKAADLNHDGKIMLSELQDYVRTNVSKLSNGKQSPTSRVQNVSMDFRIW